MKNTKIEWADHTFNPWWGCAKVGPGCDNCYAANIGNRFGVKWGNGETRRKASKKQFSQPLKWNKQAAKAGIRPRVFCASMADVFDNEVPDEWRTELWELIRITPNLDWLLLTKRIGNAAKMLPADYSAWPNLWLGATVVNQQEAERDIPKLMLLNSTIRFLSCEPLLGYIDFAAADVCKSHPIDWVIVGGESGPGARPINPIDLESIRDECINAGIPFFFKQWGEWFPRSQWEYNEDLILPDDEYQAGGSKDIIRLGETKGGSAWDETMIRVGKKKAGRVFYGKTWDQIPNGVTE